MLRGWRAGVAVVLAGASWWACGARSELRGGNARATGMGGEGGVGAAPADGGGGIGGGGNGGEGGTPFNDCTDPDATYIYLVTSSLGMYAYKPLINEIEYRGQLNCDIDPNISPFSMAVKRSGQAYVVYNDGSLWKVAVSDASCEATGYPISQQGFFVFGMGYAIDDDGLGETLYVSDIDYANNTSKGLGEIDTERLVLTPVGPFAGAPGFRIELTGDGADLYAFVLDDAVGGGYLAQVDKTSGELSNIVQVPVGSGISAWHFAAWGGDFYFFTALGGDFTTTIRRYNPVTQELVVVGTVPEPVVGAGASTCAPQ